jgi:DUF4097 and DUF4098 domain-containing protein YvlB
MTVLWLAGVSAASVDGQFQRSLQVNGPVDLEVFTRSGDITVRNGASGTVNIVGRIHVGHNLFFSDDRRADVQELEKNPPIRQNGNIVRVDYTNMRNISVDYEITVPTDTSVRTRSGSGDQTIEGIRGNVDIETGSGNLHLRDLSAGQLKFETGSGDVRGENVSGPITAHTGSGNIRMEEKGQGDVSVRTGSGDVEIRGVNGGLRAETGSGNLEVEGTPANSWNVRTGSGNAELHIGSAAVDVDLSTSSGSLNVNQPVTTTVQGRIHERKSVSGKIGGGGPLVTVHTGSGDIRLY